MGRTRILPKYLVLGLLWAAASFFVLSELFPENRYWPNFFTDAVSLLVGAFVVDRLLSRHEREAWAEADRLLSGRLQGFANASITNLRSALGFDINKLMPMRDVLAGYPNTDELFYKRVEERLEPALKRLIDGASHEQLRRLHKALLGVTAQCDDLLRLAGARLSPEASAALLRTRECARNAATPFDIFPELYGDGSPISPDKLDELWGGNVVALRKNVLQTVRELRALGASTKPSVRVVA